MRQSVLKRFTTLQLAYDQIYTVGPITGIDLGYHICFLHHSLHTRTLHDFYIHFRFFQYMKEHNLILYNIHDMDFKDFKVFAIVAFYIVKNF